MMPYSYRILTDPDLLSMRYLGHTTIQDQRDLVADVMSDADYEFGTPILLNSALMTGNDITMLSLISLRDRFVPLFAKLDRPTLWAQFAPNELSYGMCRMTQQIMDDVPNVDMQIFASLDEALAFLGLADQAASIIPRLGFGPIHAV